MDLNRYILLVCLFYFLVLSNNNNGVEGGNPLTKEEDNELEKQLKLLNKPAVKTIKTEYGDIYECVDFYKQPAFDHPLLKNHSFNFQMRPSSVPKITREKEHYTTNTNIVKVELKGLGCPFGTVPIRRVTKDDLIRANLHSDIHISRKNSNYSVLTLDSPGTHYALVRTKFDMSRKYNGGGASISIYNPYVGISQYSSGRMRIQNGPDSIQVGWTVNPPLYGNRDVRSYIYMKTSESQCFNTQCPGFVIVNRDIPLDAFLRVTKRGVLPPIVMEVMIYRDQVNGNWWLALGDNYLVGFWPQAIFTGLADLAFEVEWGGEVSGPPYIPSPPMGSNYFLKGDIQDDGFCMNITTINEAREVVDATNIEEFSDIDAYQVIDGGCFKSPYRCVAYFGGPGGATGN